MKPLIPILAATSLVAVPSTRTFEYWPAAKLQELEKTLQAKVDPKAKVKAAGTQLANFGPYFFSLSHRENSGRAELHDVENDIFVAVTGEATVVVGGQLVGAEKVAEGQTLADSIEGGTPHKLTPGDIVHIPAGMPHQLLLAPGMKFTYFVIKVVDQK
jgi:mannose-6-phosphate isomerase-like protein (cupin superfamily)